MLFMKMKKVLTGLVLTGILAAGPLRAADSAWLTSLPKALEKARADHKLVLMDFTGSDWCPWCIKLNQEVFSKPEFTAFAKKSLVLLEVDFPRRTPQAAALKEANQALLEKYKVQGFPTVLVLNSKGDKVGELGYEPGGPKPFIAKLEKLKP